MHEVPKVLLVGEIAEGGLCISYRNAFQKLGCQVGLVDPAGEAMKTLPFSNSRVVRRLLWSVWSRRASALFVQMVMETRPHLLFVFKNELLSPEAVRKARSYCRAAFHFNPDNPWGPDYLSRRYEFLRSSIPEYDCHFTWGRSIIPRLKASGAVRVEWLPFARDPELHWPVSPSDDELRAYGCDIAFVGSWTAERAWVLDALEGFDLKIWGNRWERASRNSFARSRAIGRAAIGEEFSKICSCAKICINILRPQNADAHNMRTFEIPACRGVQLATRSRDHIEFFGDGDGIVLFERPEELRLAADRLLKEPTLRRRIADRGYQMVSSHTYVARAQRVLEVFKEMA